MNTEAMLRLADHLESIEDDAFDMSSWWEPVPENICGAAACIAGWAVLTDPQASERFAQFRARHLGKVDIGMEYPFNLHGRAVLGLDGHQADALFTDACAWDGWLRKFDHHDEVESLGDITPKQAVMVLRGLATGVLQWPIQCGCLACTGEGG